MGGGVEPPAQASTALKPLFTANGPLGAATLTFPIPGVHEAIVTGAGKTVTATFSWNILGASGTAILVAALIAVLTSKISWAETFEELGGTWNQLKMPILMICLVMSVANVMNYAGMTTSIALALATAGSLFPLLSPVIGWIGVFVAGSVTNANVLFAGLQSTTATQIGVDPTLLVAANTAGGVMGKIVSPQSITIAAAAVNSAGEESKITSMSIKYSAILLVLVCVWSYALSLMMGYCRSRVRFVGRRHDSFPTSRNAPALFPTADGREEGLRTGRAHGERVKMREKWPALLEFLRTRG